MLHVESLDFSGYLPGCFFGRGCWGQRPNMLLSAGSGSAGASLGRSFFEYRRCSIWEDDRHKELCREKIILT